MKRRLLWGILIILVGVPIVVGGYLLWFLNQSEYYQSWQSPDGRHTITVWRHPRLFAMPGQGSDAPGTVTLTNRSGTKLNSTSIAMVQLASAPRWGDKRVSMKLIFDWELN